MARLIILLAVCVSLGQALPTLRESARKGPVAGTTGIVGAVGNKLFYKPSAEKVSWMDALITCHKEGMILASIENAAENELIAKLIDDEYFSDDSLYWLGGTDFGHEGEFLWVKTGKALEFTNWMENYPQGGREQNCLYTWFYSSEWRTDNCAALKIPLCMYVIE